MAFPHMLIKKKNTRKKTWITPALINEGQDLRILNRHLKNTTDFHLNVSYKNRLKLHKKNIALAKKNFNSNKLLNSNNITRAAWDIIKSETNTKHKNHSFPEKICYNNSEFRGQKDIANAFNAYFVDSVRALSDKANIDKNSINYLSMTTNTIFLLPFVEDEVKAIIKSISNKRSCFADEIPCGLLNECLLYILTPLTYLINLSLEFGYFPDTLKRAIVVPIHKKGNSASVENYRPIALLSVFSKILEKAFKKRLLNFLDSNNILTSRQYGFRVGLSTSDAILSFYLKVLNNFNNKLKTLGIFFDFTKAFDTINHNMLLNKLTYYGIRGSAHKWIESYLTGRTQAVKFSSDGEVTFSEWVDIVTGVPQGSVLGPVLFLLFINDLPLLVNNYYVTLFADDTSANVEGANYKDICQKANQCVLDISKWCEKNGLHLNGKKSHLVVFTPIRVAQDRSLLVKDKSSNLEQKECVNFLGIKIDQHLSWHEQIESVCSKLSSKNFVILQLRDIVDLATLKTFYYASIQSVLTYGLHAWGNSAHIDRVLISQKRIIRSMFRLSFRASCRETFALHKILTVINLYLLQCSCYVFKHQNNFTRCGDINRYRTRNTNDLYVPGARLTQVQEGPEILSIKIFLHLPTRLKEITVLHIFKSRLRDILAENPFYSVDEFFMYNFN